MRSMPAEWERHDCCWMAWPDHAMWGGMLPQVEAEYAAVAQAIRQFEPVRVIANPTSASRARHQLGADIELVELPLDDAWFRDAGPTFVRCDDGAVEGVCWRFNGWGGANEEFQKDAALGRAVLGHIGLPAVTSALAMEGGALAVDGAGTLLTTETVVFNENRNPGLTRAHAEAEFARTLGIRKVIWLPGNAEELAPGLVPRVRAADEARAVGGAELREGLEIGQDRGAERQALGGEGGDRRHAATPDGAGWRQTCNGASRCGRAASVSRVQPSRCANASERSLRASM